MASVNFMKLKGKSNVSAILRHVDNSERLKHEHSNIHIDKSLTKNNVEYLGRTYQQTLAAFNSRINDLDNTTNTNKRKDRVVAFALEVPTPEGLNRAQQQGFLACVFELLGRQYRAENIVAAVAHFDELHTYLDNGEVKESRPHLHVIVVPEINGTLNGKQFSSKAAMKAINKHIDCMSRERYGVPFLSGSEPRKRSVEELKRLSEEEALKQERRVEETIRQQNEVSSKDWKVKTMDAMLNHRRAENMMLKTENAILRSDNAALVDSIPALGTMKPKDKEAVIMALYERYGNLEEMLEQVIRERREASEALRRAEELTVEATRKEEHYQDLLSREIAVIKREADLDTLVDKKVKKKVKEVLWNMGISTQTDTKEHVFDKTR